MVSIQNNSKTKIFSHHFLTSLFILYYKLTISYGQYHDSGAGFLQDNHFLFLTKEN